MTPPGTTGETALRVARVALPRAIAWPAALVTGGQPATPARPSAVLVPALTVWIVATMGTVAAEHGAAAALGHEVPLFPVIALAAVLCATTLGVGYTVRVLVGSRTRHPASSGLQDAAVGAAAVAFHLAARAVFSGPPALHPLGVVVAAVLCSLGLRSAGAWRRGWMSFQPERVSVLAADVPSANAAVRELERIPGLRVESLLIPEADAHEARILLGRPVTASLDGAGHLERRVVVARPTRDGLTGGAIARLVARGHEISSASAEMRRAEGRVDSTRVDPLSLLLARPRSRVVGLLSRGIDVVGSLALLVLLAPVFLVVAVAVAVETGRPILFRQVRVGRHGRPFEILKFRSMYQDAEARSGPVWARQGDPRITKVGRFLRRTRLDEIPQLVNVLIGQMSLVGPRPERPHFCDRLRDDVPLFELRTCVRPGITGWAQVRLPYAADSDDCRAKLEYDLYYVLHRSPWFDLAILLDTVGVALRGSGAR